MSVEFKGGTTQFRAKRFYITTPKSPEATWEQRTAEDLAQLIRRIETVKVFGEPVAEGPMVAGFVPV